LPAQQFISVGPYMERSFSPANFYTLRWAEPCFFVAYIVGVHIRSPLALQATSFRRPQLHDSGTRTGQLLMLYAYLALGSSLGEYGENMRFRIAVEPVIWLITLLSGNMLWQLSRGFATPSRS
jgi:hypothetical protein